MPPEADPSMAQRMGIIDCQWMDYLRNTDALVDEIRALPNAGGTAIAPAVPSTAQAFANATRQEVTVQATPQQQHYQPSQQTQQRQQQNYQQYDNLQQQPSLPGTSNLTMAEITRNRDRQSGGNGGSYYGNRRDDYYNSRNYNDNGGRYGGGGGWAD